MKQKTVWVVVADGAQARVLAYQGPGAGLAQVEGMVFSQTPLDAQDIMADKPGRSFSSAGTGRAAMEYHSDPVQLREAAFMGDLADTLVSALQDGAFDELVIAAAPRALGDLRKALPDAVKARVTAEIPKDLTNIPSDKLDKHFEGVLNL